MKCGAQGLAEAFAVRFAGAVHEPALLEQALQRIVASARVAHPEIEVPVTDYLEYLAERARSDERAEHVLARLHTDDLYLACAAGRGDALAIAKVELVCFSSLGPAFRRLGITTWQRDEVEQRLRVRLLTCDQRGKRGLDGYAGRGPLQSWVKIVALNEARALGGSTAREVSLDDQTLAALAVAANDPALEELKQRARTAYAAAFEEAFASLTRRERNLLRCQVLDGLSSVQLAAIYHVHRATIVRQLAEIHDKLQELVRAALAAKLAIDRSEVESIERLVRSDLDVSIERLLTRG